VIFDARVLLWGVSRNQVRWSAALGPALVAALAGAPLRVYRDRTSLRHPYEGGDTDLRGLIGVVQTARATGLEVRALVEVFDQKFAAGLLALERDRLLARAAGLSLVANVLIQNTVELGQAIRRVTRIRDVVALDVVSFPSADGAILRSA
jgi:hypothetical protein